MNHSGNRREVLAAERPPRGFTLLEMLIAGSVGLVLLGVIIQIIQGTRQSMNASANSFQAIHVSAKILSDLAEDARVEADFLGAFDRFSELRTKDPVVDGTSLYFRYFKDREPPFGRIDPAREGGIRRDDGATYDQLKTFEAQVRATAQAPAGSTDWRRHIAETETRITWKERDGRTVAYSIPLLVPSPVGPRPLEGLEMKEAVLEREMINFLFPGITAPTFDRACLDNGCDPLFARAVARVGVLAEAGLQGLASLTAELNDLAGQAQPLLAAPEPRLVELRYTMARRADAGASLVYQVLVALLDDIALIRSRADAALLGPISFASFRRALESYGRLTASLDPWLERARTSYEWLLQDSLRLLVSHHDREFALFKTLDALRLQLALGKVDPATVGRFIDREAAKAAGRNPYLERLFLREEETCRSASEVRRRFPSIDQICTKLTEAVRPFLAEVPTLLRCHPSCNGGAP